jgi:4-diphosphocytidyl-2-C-methyl-D-erythritol kinase
MHAARAPGKINLYLEVLGRRADGYHELETLMAPIRLADSLTLTATSPAPDGLPGEIKLRVRSCLPMRGGAAEPEIPVDQANLVVKALQLLQAQSGCEQGAAIELVKRIPAAAGLGGASSDAAAALRLANQAWQIYWPVERLSQLAAEIGCDVPFFVHGGPAICRGRGEVVEPIPHLRPLHLVVVKPPVELKTANVYREYDAAGVGTNASDDRRREAFQNRRVPHGWDDLAQWLHNGLQTAAARLSPWVERLRTIFHHLDCPAHQLCGSGSAYFGVCRHAQHARRLTNILRNRQLGLVYATSSCP